jgi:hypothetical protein
VAFVLFQYWPFLAAALVAGVGVGWWAQDPGSRKRQRMADGPR